MLNGNELEGKQYMEEEDRRGAIQEKTGEMAR